MDEISKDSHTLLGEDSGSPWVLHLSAPDGARERILVCGEQCTIGRGPGADLRVDDPALGCEHVRVIAGTEAVVVHCLDSHAGMYVGGLRLERAELSGREGNFVIGSTAVCLARHERDEEPVERCSPIPELVGSSAAMRRLTAQVRRWAPLSAPVLLQGESGTGKDVVARALHTLSGRKGRYVAINVGALTEALADSELFGHKRGAFTGALSSRPGVFEEADGGTLFLDEIADLSSAVQVKLLRVLEERKVRPLGGNHDIAVRARVVTASWASLAERVHGERFRGDLFHRISTVTLKVPPLRQRKADIPALAQHLLARYAAELGEKQLAAGALGQLLAYPWPGNIRELGAVLYRAAAASPTRTIESLAIEGALPKGPRKAVRVVGAAEAAQLLSLYQGNVSAAARAAQLPRTTFRALLARHERGSWEAELAQNRPKSANP